MYYILYLGLVPFGPSPSLCVGQRLGLCQAGFGDDRSADSPLTNDYVMSWSVACGLCSLTNLNLVSECDFVWYRVDIALVSTGFHTILMCVSGIGRFTLIPVHTAPDDAPVEISALVDVYNDSVRRWTVTDSFILGDFNADCDYVRSRDWPNILLWTDSRFLWLIGNDADTNIAVQSSCAYDRIVVAGDQLQSNIVNGSVNVFRFDEAYNLTNEEAKLVSDHYPVEVTLMGTTRFQILASTSVPSSTVGPSSSETPSMSEGRSSALSMVVIYLLYFPLLLVGNL